MPVLRGARLLQFGESTHPTHTNTAYQVFGSVLVEFQSLPAVNLGIRLLEARAKSIEVYLILFNETVHGFLHE